MAGSEDPALRLKLLDCGARFLLALPRFLHVFRGPLGAFLRSGAGFLGRLRLAGCGVQSAACASRRASLAISARCCAFRPRAPHAPTRTPRAGPPVRTASHRAWRLSAPRARRPAVRDPAVRAAAMPCRPRRRRNRSPMFVGGGAGRGRARPAATPASISNPRGCSCRVRRPGGSSAGSPRSVVATACRVGLGDRLAVLGEESRASP